LILLYKKKKDVYSLFKIAFISIVILIILFTALFYVGVYITYIGMSLVLIYGVISLSGFCKSKRNKKF